MRVALAMMGLLAAVASARADESKVEIKDVPQPVLKAVEARFPGAKIEEAAKEVDGGETTYEISLISKGIVIDVALEPDGEIEEIETETAVADLPKAVTNAILAKHAGAKIMKAEEIVEFEDGKEEGRFYEVVIVHESKRQEVKLTPAGEFVKAEDDDD